MTPEATIGEQEYCSLKEAIDDANSGDTIELLKDVDVTNLSTPCL